MNAILNIETSTKVCSVSVSLDNSLLASRESRVDRSHASMLTVFIEEAMREADKKFSDLSAVAVSKGPGSYTGLRIGVSAAKGICFATGLPLIGVNTLKTMVWKVIRSFYKKNDDNNSMAAAKVVQGSYKTNICEMLSDKANDNLLLCPMIDARRMEVYMAMFDPGGKQVTEISASIIDGSSFVKLLKENKIIFFGDGAEKCKELIRHPHAIFLPGIYPSARQMAELSHKAFLEGRFEDIAYFEPFYLKDFIATTPKKNVF